ncbi:efflux RND transporter permease subunit [Flavivirga amylovorans]|uniref:Efflux RND transporter permease subunit n=1 Tax=Flavivirga amylovorans TaxID=870486 RepID=A0ABT8WXQ4_9FLAO|nr:efflux RND transporter permease subunit [Flavivirga amylovorans]MDO5986258.1 efflux RND transporter permease subunit [Flavivirga amylovorans]
METKKMSKAEMFFNKAIKYPWLIIISCILLVGAVTSQLPKMVIDTTIEAYIPAGHHSLENREEVRDIFGLSDPIVVAVVNEEKEGVFTPEMLNFIKKLSEEVQLIEGVDPEKITSLSTENNIYGTETGMVVDPFIGEIIGSQNEADKIRKDALSFPLYKGNLVSIDGTTSLIVIELLDKIKYGKQAYKDIKKLSEELLSKEVKLPNAQVHVAGEGGVISHQAEYIDGDAKKMTPLAFLVILIVLIIAYRTFRGLYLSIIVIFGSVLTAMGVMAAVGVPMYLSSNVIPVILIAISVADAIHILGAYYEILAKYPNKSSREVTLITMKEMWRPVTFTSLTNIAGFLALGLTSTVPPLRMVGIFSSVGVLAAWLLSLFLVPAILILLKPKLSKAYQKATLEGGIKTDIFGRFMEAIGRSVLAKPKFILGITVMIFIIGFLGASKVYVDEASIDNFSPATDIYKADRLINSKMNGANTFDVMVSAKEDEGLYKPENLKKIESLQRYIETLPNVGGTTSIVDIIKQMNKSLNENKEEAYVIPDDGDMVAQLFLLYSASGDPADLEKFIDYDYSKANIAITLNDGKYTSAKKVIEPLKQHIATQYANGDVEVKIAGWMNIFYYWLGGIGFSNYLGLIIALIAVWVLTSLSFKSAIAGLYAVFPVFTAIFMFYAVMGYSGITLNTATTMFGAIAIGVAVDFAIHIIQHIKDSVTKKGLSIEEGLIDLFPSTGRALLFNVIAICLGFGINMTSSLPPFIIFGALITTCVASSFLASITILPALIKTFKPKFLSPVKTN